MYNRTRLLAIEEEEEAAFRSLPEEVQSLALGKKKAYEINGTNYNPISEPYESGVNGGEAMSNGSNPQIPPLISEEAQKEKQTLLSEGFSDWSRTNYASFTKASAKYGRSEIVKIASETGKSDEEVLEYSNAFWGDIGKERISKHEYERVANLVAKGEKKIAELKALKKGVRIFISLFENPWEEIEFTHVNTKDKLFSIENDRYLLCWTHKFGIGQWSAIKMAIRRSPVFRFDYFLRTLPIDQIGRRCEYLMRSALKEVEFLEKKYREDEGLPLEAKNGEKFPPVVLPKIRDIQKRLRMDGKERREKEKKNLEEKVENLEVQIKAIQDRLKELSQTPNNQKENLSFVSKESNKNNDFDSCPPSKETTSVEEDAIESNNGAKGPHGDFVAFPEYDGSYPPKDPKKAFAQFCQKNRKHVKTSLEPKDRINKDKVNSILRERFTDLTDEELHFWRGWASWDKARYEHDRSIYAKTLRNGNKETKKRHAGCNLATVPKKKKRQRNIK